MEPYEEIDVKILQQVRNTVEEFPPQSCPILDSGKFITLSIVIPGGARAAIGKRCR
jgi:hypothetical protein